MKRIRMAALVTCALLFWAGSGGGAVQLSGHNAGAGAGDDALIGRAFKTGTSNVQVEGAGVVTSILTDDLDGDRHQRFIVRLASSQTLLVTHNLDIAPRVEGLRRGDRISFNGEYIWNAKGGVVHWTHRDPAGRHVAGWLKHKGRIYQ